MATNGILLGQNCNQGLTIDDSILTEARYFGGHVGEGSLGNFTFLYSDYQSDSNFILALCSPSTSTSYEYLIYKITNNTTNYSLEQISYISLSKDTPPQGIFYLGKSYWFVPLTTSPGNRTTDEISGYLSTDDGKTWESKIYTRNYSSSYSSLGYLGYAKIPNGCLKVCSNNGSRYSAGNSQIKLDTSTMSIEISAGANFGDLQFVGNDGWNKNFLISARSSGSNGYFYVKDLLEKYSQQKIGPTNYGMPQGNSVIAISNKYFYFNDSDSRHYIANMADGTFEEMPFTPASVVAAYPGYLFATTSKGEQYVFYDDESYTGAWLQVKEISFPVSNGFFLKGEFPTNYLDIDGIIKNIYVGPTGKMISDLFYYKTYLKNNNIAIGSIPEDKYFFQNRV